MRHPGDSRRLSKVPLQSVKCAMAVVALSVGLFAIPAGAAQPVMSTAVNCTPLAGSTIGCPNPPTQPGGLDHFLCYPVQSDGFSPPLVDLTDQFGTHNLVQPLSASTPAGATDNQFCNPVIKTPGNGSPATSGPVYGVSNAQAHLYCFSDPTIPAPTTQVSVTNQFGTGTLTLGNSTRLCLPSWKEDPNVLATNPLASGSVPPTLWTDPNDLNLNHFQCYQVASVAPGGFASLPSSVGLVDQFSTSLSVGGLFHPVELCAPVIKQVVDSTGTPIGGPSTINGDGVDGAHLLCFGVGGAGPASRTISVGNQFSAPPASAIPNPTSVVVGLSDQLCLPSFKSVIPNPQAPEAPSALLLPLAGVGVVSGALVIVRRRRRLLRSW